MMTYLLQSALILTLFYAAYKILFERFTFFQHNRIFLLSGLGLSMLLPFLPLNFSEERTEYIYLPKNYFENLSSDVTTSSNSGFFWQEWTFGDWLILVYFAGVFLFSLMMLWQILQISLLIKKGKLVRKDGMKLVFTEKTTSPFSFFNTIVINPEMLSGEQLNHIITHENIHIGQWHQLDVVMAEILKIVLWFFPVSWWYGKSIRTNLEFIADTNSLENGLDKKAYQLNLVSISQQPSGSVLVNNFSKKLIKNRIKMLNKMKTKRQILSFYAVLIPVLVLISFGISVKAQSQNEKVKQVIVLSDEKILPEDVKVQIKNENREFEDLDSVKLNLVETSDLPNPVKFEDKTLSEPDSKLKEVWLWNSDKSDYQVYKNGKFQGNLSELTKDSVILLNDKNPIKLPKIKNSDSTIILLNGKDLREIPKGLSILVDSIETKNQKIYLKNGKALKVGENGFNVFSDEMKVQPKNKKGSTVIAYQSGEKNESNIIVNGKNFKNSSYFVGNKKVTKKEFDKITENKHYKISYIISDDAKMVKKYGKEVSTNGIVLAEKK